MNIPQEAKNEYITPCLEDSFLQIKIKKTKKSLRERLEFIIRDFFVTLGYKEAAIEKTYSIY